MKIAGTPKQAMVTIRQEKPEDYTTVAEILEAAFRDQEYSDHREHILVARLRKSEAFVPELSLVAETENEVVGHILLTTIQIVNGATAFPSLALAPVSVRPEFQRRGIGGKLITEAHKISGNLGYRSVVLLGHAAYYPKFGYEPAEKYGIQLPFDAPPENCLVLPLVTDGLEGVSGKVVYPPEFFS